MVAHTSRKRACCHRLLPTRLYVPSCTTRSNSACSAGGNSPTSSRKSVPPSASAKAPSRAATAPVNAPRSWPNNSLPDSDGTIVVQSTTISSPLAVRGSSVWISCAMSSLPVPLSPVIRTSTSLKRAISTTSRRTARHTGLEPTRCSAINGEPTSSSTARQRSIRADTAATSPSQATTSVTPAASSSHAAALSKIVGVAAIPRMRRRPARLCSRASSRRRSSTRSKSNAPGPSPSGAGGGPRRSDELLYRLDDRSRRLRVAGHGEEPRHVRG